MMMSKSKYDEKVQVTVRCRPMNQSERQRRVKKVVECNSKGREVTIASSITSVGLTGSHQTKSYSFDRVFGTNATQIDVYKSVIESQLQDVLAGYNCTVLAYGQTGTGKTYTMEGERSVDENYTWDTDPRAGIIPRALSQLFDCLEKAGNDFSVRVSLLEIYNEEIYDLLSSSNDMPKMKIYEDNCRKGSVVVSNLTEIHVRNKSDVYDILQQGAAKRRTAATNLNEFSSRSHSVFSVTVHTKDVTHNNMEEEELVKIGKLNLVDLAGSENIGRSGAVDKRAREAGNINQSLLTLGRCITALVDRAPHIPYRESKLTRLLQDSLGGATKTSIIATISPGNDNFEETMSTLDYAARAKNIHNKPKVNQKLTKRALIKEYEEEMDRLRRECAVMREKSGVYVDPQRYDEMIAKIEELTAAVKLREDEIAKLEELFTTKSDQLTSCTEELQIFKHDLIETSKELAEQCCLKNAHVEHGQEAIKYASNLLETTSDATADIEQVHNKVDRVSRTIEKNKETLSSFTKRIETDADNMCNETTSGVEENKINIQATMDGVEKLQQIYSKAMDELSLNSANFRQLSTDLQTDIVTKLDSSLTRHGDQSGLKKEMANKIMTLVEEQCQKSKENLPQLDDVTRTLVQMTEDIEEDSKEICSQIEDKMQLPLKTTHQIQEHLEEMNDFVKMEQRQKMKSQEKLTKEKIILKEKADKEMKKSHEEKKKLQENLGKEIMTLQEEMKKLQEENKKSQEKTYEDMTKFITKSQEEKKKSQEKLDKEIMILQEENKKSQEKTDEAMMKFIAKSQEETKKLQEKLDKKIMILQEEMKKLQEENTKLQEKIDEEMMKSKEKSDKEEEQLIADHLHQDRECSNAISEVCEDKSRLISAASSSLNEDMAQWGNDTIANNKAREVEWVKSLKNSNQSIESYKREESDLVTSTQSTVKELCADMSSLVDRTVEDARNVVSDCKNIFKVSCKETEKIDTNCELVVNEAKKDSGVEIEIIKESLAALAEGEDAIKTTVEEGTCSIVAQGYEYMKQEVEDVVPTGMTPARKEYKFSRNIPQPPIEEDVLLNFRDRSQDDELQDDDEEDDVLNQEIDEADGSSSQASKSDTASSDASGEPIMDQSITIPDGGGVPFFKKDKHRRAKLHSSLKQPSRVPLRPMHNVNN